ncbi:PhoP regulatory network YrbL family protein [Aliarcobacter cryaerophilus]|uniref:PhoP regulatory network YrbL family protein n=1 Tax=Aliarcobacter cryaerophilus TaxID=28198 RepID=UPI0021B64936|nr:PhoP regulatory network YrbL family protein [Aliarcobacter cryaerophilus]MCT7539499.1 PhoP regulatory network YrbL family protein [Aliarcobacter cryaerophilus]
MNEKIVLTDDLFITKGTGRKIYSHPFDNSKIVKISTEKKIYRDQNIIENIYYNYLHKHNIDINNIVKCYGYVNTNLGKGLVFDKVCDYTGEISKTYSKAITNKNIAKETLLKLFNDFEENILKNHILFMDTSFGNIMCCEYEKEKYKLIVIDGLGGTNILRFILMLYSDRYRTRRINKAKNIMFNKLKKLKLIDNE